MDAPARPGLRRAQKWSPSLAWAVFITGTPGGNRLDSSALGPAEPATTSENRHAEKLNKTREVAAATLPLQNLLKRSRAKPGSRLRRTFSPVRALAATLGARRLDSRGVPA